MKKAMTVLGPVDEDRLGHILPHEHLLLEPAETYGESLYPSLADKKVTMEILGKLRRQPWACRDNLHLDNAAETLREAAQFKEHGGETIVDVTPAGMGRNIGLSLVIARETRLNLIAGTSLCTAPGHNAKACAASPQELYQRFLDEVTVGIEGTGAMAGMIGEISVSAAGDPLEEKVLRAAARACRETGAPLSLGQTGGKELEWIDSILMQEGVKPEKATLCHMCTADSAARLWAADKGYYVGLDRFGHEYYLDALSGYTIRDPQRVAMARELIDRGYRRQVLISCDIKLKMLMKQYGGWGYEHILVNMKPFMVRSGISPKAVDTMIYYNPARALAYLD